MILAAPLSVARVPCQTTGFPDGKLRGVHSATDVFFT
jgi:hypothetical protein